MKKQILKLMVGTAFFAANQVIAMNDEADSPQSIPIQRKDVGQGIKAQNVPPDVWNSFGETYQLWGSLTDGFTGILAFRWKNSPSKEQN